MAEEQPIIELVRLAQRGREDCMNRLAQRVKDKLCAYAYRVTLDYHLSQDLSQEVLLEMVKSLKRLRKVEQFWPWLYRIAQSKIQQHYRIKYRKAAIPESAIYKDFLSQRPDFYEGDGLRQVIRKELSTKIVVAMKRLRQQYRAVLSLRCFEELSYSDIALAMQCSEVKARVLFFRAKQDLKKQLARLGVGKGSLLLGLGLFGKLTAPSEAASSGIAVSAVSAKVSLSTAIVATASTKLGVATVAAAVGLATVGGISALSESALPQRAEVATIHYTTQLRYSGPGAVSSLSKGAYEQWFYFPEGIDGPMFMRMQRWDPQQSNKRCAWLQDGNANYYYESGGRQVYINNYRVFWSSLKVWRLPTDGTEFTRFLSQVEGASDGVKYTRDRKTGLLASAVDYRFVDAPYFQTTYEYNTLDASQFEYDWLDSAPAIDDRDEMHRRGWTYFRIDGRVSGQAVSGRGRIPFVYNAYKENRPWLTLNIGDQLQIIDCNDGAYLYNGASRTATYPAQTFFSGLARPWMGMHTINIVRRDAAKQRISFETVPSENEKAATVTFTCEQDFATVELVYTIDLLNDIIEEIDFNLNNRNVGSLAFSYHQRIDQAGDEFAEPVVYRVQDAPAPQSRGMLWLIDLAQGDLAR
jgi:RNA polymerase sigma-70 factor (ECF subfamily)